MRVFRRTDVTTHTKSRPANGTFGFSRHTSQRSKNQKSHFLPTHEKRKKPRMNDVNKYLEVLVGFSEKKLKSYFDIDKLGFENFEIVNSYLIHQTIKDKKNKKNTLIFIPNGDTKSQFYLPVIFTLAIYNFTDNYIDDTTEYIIGDILQKKGSRYEIINKTVDGYVLKGNGLSYPTYKQIKSYIITNSNLKERKVKLKFDLYRSFFASVIKEDIKFLPSKFKYKSIIVTDKSIVEELKTYEIDGEKIHKAFPFRYVTKSGVESDNIPIEPMIYIVNDYETARKYILEKGIKIRNITFIGQNKYKEYYLEISEDLNNNKIENCLFVGSSDFQENAIPNLLKWKWTLPELDYFNYFETFPINKIIIEDVPFSKSLIEFDTVINKIENDYGINLKELYKFVRNILPIIIPSQKSRLVSQLENTLIYFQNEGEDIVETALDEIGEYDYEEIWNEILEKFKNLIDCKRNSLSKFEEINSFQKIDYLVVPKEYCDFWIDELKNNKVRNIISFKEFNQLEVRNKTIVFLGFFGYNHLKSMMYNSNKINILLYQQEDEYFESCFQRLKNEIYSELRNSYRKEISEISFKETEYIENVDELIKRLFGQEEDSKINPDYSESYNISICRVLGFENDTECLELDENKTVLLKINNQERFEKVKNLTVGDKIRVYDNSSKEELYQVALHFDNNGEFSKIEEFSKLWKNELKAFYAKFNSLEELHHNLMNVGLSIKNEQTLHNWTNINSNVKFPQRKKDLSVLRKAIDSIILNENYSNILKYRIGYNRIMISLGRKFSSEITEYILTKKKGQFLQQFSEIQIQQFVNQNAKERTIKSIKAIENEQ